MTQIGSGVGCGNIPMWPPRVGGWRSTFQKGCSGSCNRIIILFVCLCKNNNYAFTFVAGCLQQF